MDQQGPLDNNTTPGPRDFAIVLTLFAVSLCLYVPRILTHLVLRRKVKASDYIISLAVVLEIINIALMGVAVKEGLGRRSRYMSSEQMAVINRYAFWERILGVWTSSLVRASTAIVLLQFGQSIQWRVTLYGVIVVQIVLVVSSDLTALLQCRPIRAMWEVLPGSECWKAGQIFGVFYFTLGAAAISDLAFAFMPIFAIWKLNRPLFERLLVMVLMALGLCAMGTMLVRGVDMARLTTTSDIMRHTVYQMTLCRIEACVLIAASCAPFLKGPIERCLSHRFGISEFYNTPLQLNSISIGIPETGDTSSTSISTSAAATP